MKKYVKLISGMLMIIMSCLSFSLTGYAKEAEKETTPSGILFSDLKESITDYSQNYIGSTTAGASVAVLQNSEVVYSGNFGYADINKKVLIDEDTLFEWGSATKLLVWVSVMQLVEQGKIDINEDIKKYLPDGFFTKLQYDNPITMLNLMNHNAGWEEHLTDLFYYNAKDVRSLKDTLEVFEPNQLFRPGEVVAYSNYGASVAAYIVECVSGMEFYEYVNEYIFNVLDMNRTSIHSLQEDNEYVKNNRSLTKGYTLSRSDFVERPLLYLGLYPAGGAIGTVSDLCKFVSSLIPAEGAVSPLFKNKDTLLLLFSKSYQPVNDFPGICHGFWEQYYSVMAVEHGGNTDSFSAQITIAQEEGFATVVMTNQAHERYMCYGLPDLLFGSCEETEYDGELPNSEVVEGTYQNARKPYSGFTQWMNLIVNEVAVLDKNEIDVDGDIYRQIRPYVYLYTDEGGASEFIYFEVKDSKVIRMYMEYGDYLPMDTLGTIAMILPAILVIMCFVFSMVVIIVTGIRILRKRGELTKFRKSIIILNSMCVMSVVNIGILLYRATTYPSYLGLKIHFVINILVVILIFFHVVKNIINAMKEKKNEKLSLSYILTNTISSVYAVLIIACQLYK